MDAIKKNLRDEVFKSHRDGKRVMYCPVCLAQFSAHSGDYWDVPDNHAFTCCGMTMRLGVPYSGIDEVRA